MTGSGTELKRVSFEIQIPGGYILARNSAIHSVRVNRFPDWPILVLSLGVGEPPQDLPVMIICILARLGCPGIHGAACLMLSHSLGLSGAAKRIFW